MSAYPVRSPMEDAIQLYARLGWAMVVLAGKRPVHNDWPNRATSDERRILAELADREDANLGIATGDRSGFWALDVDGPEGEASLAALVEEHGPLPATLEARTGGGGRHILFAMPADRPLGNRKRGLGPKLDVRGTGGQIVVAPSVHPETGALYEWATDPTETAIAPAPAWLLAILAAPEPAPVPVLGRTVVVDINDERARKYGTGALASEVRDLAGHPPGGRNQALNRAAFRLGQLAAATGLTEAEAVEGLRGAAASCGLLADDGEHQFRKTFRSGWAGGVAAPRALPESTPQPVLRIGGRAVTPAPAGPATGGGDGGGTDDEDERPTVVIRGGELDRAVTEAEAALMLADIKVYQRGGQLVRPVYQPQATTRGIERRDGALLIKAVEEAWLVEAFTRAATFQKWDARSQSLKAVDCPAAIARTYLAREGRWKVPPLVGIIESPTIRPDGTVLDRPGYDAATGLLFTPGRTTFPAIATNPTREDAVAALGVVRELLAGFPFDAPHDLTIAIAAIATALVRRTVPSSPLFAFNAPKMGSGKTLLADVASLVATGRPAAVMTPAPDAEEEAKRLLVVLMEGDPVAVIDNISAPWASDAMCSILSQETYKGRILGSSKNVSVPTATTWMATGNNLKIHGDLTTRVLRCDLDPQVERPEERTFTVDLKSHIPEQRGAIAAAVLTILRAYHAAGRPRVDVPTFGRFEAWSTAVRAPLVWLGLADPCLSRADLEAEDTVRTGLVRVLAAWHEAVGSERMTVQQIVGLTKDPTHDELREALMEIAGRAGEVNARSVGKWLAKHEKRIEGGYRAEKATLLNGNQTWKVSLVRSGLSGNSGDCIPPYAEMSGDDKSHDKGETHPLNALNPLDLEEGEL